MSEAADAYAAKAERIAAMLREAGAEAAARALLEKAERRKLVEKDAKPQHYTSRTRIGREVIP